MYEIWIEDAERELYRQDLPEGQYILGRSKQNEIYVPNLSISRQHLRLELDRKGAQVTDLASTNGTRLNGNPLQPNQTYEWPIEAILQAGDLVVHIKTAEVEFSGPPEDELVVSYSHDQQRTNGAARDLVFTVVSTEAEPKILALTAQPVFVGRDDSCAIRLFSPKVAARHCLIHSLQLGVVVRPFCRAVQQNRLGRHRNRPPGRDKQSFRNHCLRCGQADPIAARRPPAHRLPAFGIRLHR